MRAAYCGRQSNVTAMSNGKGKPGYLVKYLVQLVHDGAIFHFLGLPRRVVCINVKHVVKHGCCLAHFVIHGLVGRTWIDLVPAALARNPYQRFSIRRFSNRVGCATSNLERGGAAHSHNDWQMSDTVLWGSAWGWMGHGTVRPLGGIIDDEVAPHNEWAFMAGVKGIFDLFAVFIQHDGILELEDGPVVGGGGLWNGSHDRGLLTPADL